VAGGAERGLVLELRAIVTPIVDYLALLGDDGGEALVGVAALPVAFAFYLRLDRERGGGAGRRARAGDHQGDRRGSRA
jgi:hypothetical protein